MLHQTNEFKDLLDKGLINMFMDDILLETEDIDNHKSLLLTILKRIAQRGLLLNMEKCRFGYQKIEFLGYMVYSDGKTK